MGLDTMILLFWMLSFKPAFSLSSFTLIRRFFSSSLLSAIRVVPCTYLRVLTFFLEPWFQLVIHPAQWPHDWKKSVFILIPKKGNAKECSNYCTIAIISHTSKAMLKILQARLQQYVNCELPDVQAGFRKGRGTRNQVANICWIIEKARGFQKNIYFCFIVYAKPLTVWITINCGKFWKRWEYQTTWPASWETCIQVRKQQLELDMEQQTGSK